MPEHEGTNMHNGSGTPLTPEQRHALDELRAAVDGLQDAIAHRDEMVRQANSAGIDTTLVLQTAEIV